MPDIRLTDQEWAALVDEPAELLKLYVALRRAMDFRSGIAGLRPRLSEAFFLETLTVTAVRGRHRRPSPTCKTLYTLQRRLDALGLAVARPDLGPVVFFLPEAPQDGAKPIKVPERYEDAPEKDEKKQPTYNPFETDEEAMKVQATKAPMKVQEIVSKIRVFTSPWKPMKGR